jgi:putative endonuclease
MIAIAWVYIITNENNTTLYVGATNDLSTRLWEHRTQQNPNSFSAQYNLCKLIFFEEFNSIEEAFDREGYIKGKTRKWKESLIKTMNPEWLDLTEKVPHSS